MNEIDKNIIQSLTYSSPEEINKSIDEKYSDGMTEMHCSREYHCEDKTSLEIYKENLIKSYCYRVLTEKPEENEW